MARQEHDHDEQQHHAPNTSRMEPSSTDNPSDLPGELLRGSPKTHTWLVAGLVAFVAIGIVLIIVYAVKTGGTSEDAEDTLAGCAAVLFYFVQQLFFLAFQVFNYFVGLV